MIKEIVPGYHGTERGLVKKLEKRVTTTGKPYYSVTVMDKDSELTANAFDCGEEIEKLIGKVAVFEAKADEKYVNFSKFAEAFGERSEDYVHHAPFNSGAGMKYVYDRIAEISDASLRTVTEYLIRTNEKKYSEYAAGRSMHHDCLNGLLYHSVRMLALATQMCATYKNLDRDLMYAGTILHDIGKVRELETDEFGATEYTLCGNFFGHLQIGAEMISEACAELGIDRNEERIMMLRHMILSHHGTLDKGAVKEPMFAEAYALSMIDDLDSRMWMYEFNDNTPPGETSESKVRGLNTRTYKRSY